MSSVKLAVLGLLLALAGPMAAPTHGASASKWLRLRTAHFELVGEASQKELARVGQRFEQFRETFGRLYPNIRQAAAPVVIIVFRTTRAYEPFMPLFNGKRVEVGGYFLSRPNINYITMSLDSGEAAWRIVFHEYTHLLVGASLAEVPVWFNEGLAEYNSTFLVEQSGRKATLGKIVESHVLQLREQFIPLRELMAVRHDSPLYNEGDRRSVFYAESWALMHYLMVGKPERTPQLAKYLQMYGAGAPVAASAFREAFGVDEISMEKELRLYVGRPIFQMMVYTLTDPVEIDRTAVATPMSEAEGAAVLGDLLLQNERLDEASTHLERAVSLDPALGRAHAALGRVRLFQSRDVDALKLLDEGVSRAGDDYLPSYYLAMALLRPEKGPLRGLPPEKAAAERGVALLQNVVAAQPDLADAHALLGYGHLVLGNRDQAVQSLTKAHTISPRQEYALMTAHAYAANREAAKARRVLNALVEHGESEGMRQQARDALERLSIYEHALAGETPSVAAAAAATASPDASGTTTSTLREPIVVPVFREVRTGEKRLAGVLKEISCSREAIVLVVDAAGADLRVGAPEFTQIDFISYRDDLKGGVSCGRRAAPESVYVTWRADGPPGTTGRAVAVEFLPAGFKP